MDVQIGILLALEKRCPGPQLTEDNLCLDSCTCGCDEQLLGIACLLSFAARTARFVTTGSFGFSNDVATHATVLLHALLSASSLLFNVRGRRVASIPAVWPGARVNVQGPRGGSTRAPGRGGRSD